MQLKSSKKQLKLNAWVPKKQFLHRYAITCDVIAYHLVHFVSISVINKCQSSIDFYLLASVQYNSGLWIKYRCPVQYFAEKHYDESETLTLGCQQGDEQGWQSTGQYAYWPDQWSLLVLTGHYWSIGGQLVDWKKWVDVKTLGIIYPPFYWNL